MAFTMMVNDNCITLNYINEMIIYFPFNINYNKLKTLKLAMDDGCIKIRQK